MKKGRIISSMLVLIMASGFVLSGCGKADAKYFAKVSQYSFWDNQGAESIPQYQYYHIMDQFLSRGTVQDGKLVDSEGKTLKVLFLGWDGVRADAIANLFYDANCFDTNGHNYEAASYSGLHRLKKTGGLYLAYAGGERGPRARRKPLPARAGRANSPGDGKRSMALTAIMT